MSWERQGSDLVVIRFGATLMQLACLLPPGSMTDLYRYIPTVNKVTSNLEENPSYFFVPGEQNFPLIFGDNLSLKTLQPQKHGLDKEN